jgi:hypothetical protein
VAGKNVDIYYTTQGRPFTISSVDAKLISLVTVALVFWVLKNALILAS